MKIAIIVSLFNKGITSAMLVEAKKALSEEGIPENEIEIFTVPGSFEIPLMAQKLADAKKYDGLIALGSVIRGETDHYDYICKGITYGIQKVSIENKIPIMFGVLTCHTIDQAWKRVGKGYDCGKGLMQVLKQLPGK